MRLFYRNNRILWMLVTLSVMTLAGSVQEVYGQYILREYSMFEGSDKISPTGNAGISVRVRNGGTDVTNQFTWTLEADPVTCGGALKLSLAFPQPTPTDPFTQSNLILSGATGNIQEGVYRYRIVGKHGTGAVVTTRYCEFVVRSPKNKAPEIKTVYEVDTTLEAGVNAIPYLEIKGIASDTCTDKVTISWEQLEGPSVQNYSPGTGNLTLQNVPVGTYLFRITAKDDRDMAATRTVQVYIRRKELPSITLMKAFSPNEDGVDDLWKIANISISGKQYSIKIINQHGHMVLHARPPFIDDTVWDGTLYGKPMPEGAYYYMIFDKNNQVVDKGSVMLVR